MTDGFYAFYYTGIAGSGFGILVLKDGIIAGADAAGGIYDGEYRSNQNTGTLTGTMRMKMQAGIPLVTGAPASNEPYTVEFPISFPQNLESEGPLRIDIPTGPVNVNFRKIRDCPG